MFPDLLRKGIERGLEASLSSLDKGFETVKDELENASKSRERRARETGDPQWSPGANQESVPADSPAGETDDTDDTDETEDGKGVRQKLEQIVPEMLKRGLERGIEASFSTWERGLETSRGTTEAVKEALSEGKLPKEIASTVFSQVEDTRNLALRMVAREVRGVLEATDIASEIKAALTSLSFEIKMEVRFIPNEAGTGVTPDIRSTTRVKPASGKKPR